MGLSWFGGVARWAKGLGGDSGASASNGLSEADWAEILAPKYNARVEVSLWDSTRCDLVNEEYAIEIDWAYKWAEAIGQCLYYSIVLNKKPAIVLLMKSRRDRKYAHRAQAVCAQVGITMYLEETWRELPS